MGGWGVVRVEGRGRGVTSENNDTAGGGYPEAARAGVSPGN